MSEVRKRDIATSRFSENLEEAISRVLLHELCEIIGEGRMILVPRGGIGEPISLQVLPSLLKSFATILEVTPPNDLPLAP